MPRISIGTLRYDIVSDTTSFTKGIKAVSKQKKQADRIFREGLTPMQKHNFALIRLMELYKKGMITRRQVMQQQKKEKILLHQRLGTFTKANAANKVAVLGNTNLAGSYAKVSGSAMASSVAINADTRARLRNAKAGGPYGPGGRGNMMANVGGSVASGLGFGGAGGGIGRVAGQSAMIGGLGGTALLGGFLGSMVVGNMIKEYAELETAMVDMQVIMGDDKAAKTMIDGFRELARVTPLTSKALIKGAQTMIGYGVASENVAPVMRQIGEIAGGDTQKMEALTRAFSQIQSAGKLMGQELLQLVNAGFPIKSIADAAGVSMKEFRKEMEKGNISATHVAQAFRNLTKEGGMMYGRLAAQADTVAGSWTILKGTWEQVSAEAGEGLAPAIVSINDNLTTMVKLLGEAADAWRYLSGETDPANPNKKKPLDKRAKGGLTEEWENANFFEGLGINLRNYLLASGAFGDKVSMKDLSSQMALDNRFANMDATAKKKKAQEEEEAATQRQIRENAMAERDKLIEAQKKEAEQVRASFAAEEDQAAMEKRHYSEWYQAQRDVLEMRKQGLSDAETLEYLKALKDRQKAEQEAMDIKKKQREQEEAEAKAQAKYKKNLEKIDEAERAQEEKDRKKFDKMRKAEAEKQKRFNAMAGDMGRRGTAAVSGADTYTAGQRIANEFAQAKIQQLADQKRNKALDDIKKLEEDQAKKRKKHFDRTRKWQKDILASATTAV